MLCLPIDRNMTFAPGPSQKLLNIDGIKILYMIDEGIFMHLYYTHTPTHSGVKSAEAELLIKFTCIAVYICTSTCFKIYKLITIIEKDEETDGYILINYIIYIHY